MKRTPKQLSEAEGVSLSLVYALVKQGRLAAYRVGCRGRGKLLIEDADWAAFLASCKAPAPGSVPDGKLKYLR